MQKMGFEPTQKHPINPVKSTLLFFHDKVCDKIFEVDNDKVIFPSSASR
jgi:hypothetical protein